MIIFLLSPNPECVLKFYILQFLATFIILFFSFLFSNFLLTMI